MKSPWTEIERDIAEASSAVFHIEQRTAASGGDINAAWVVSGSGARYFVKTNDPECSTMFEAEAAGLEALRRAGAMRVPEPICHGGDHEASWIVLEHIVVRLPAAGGRDDRRAAGPGLNRGLSPIQFRAAKRAPASRRKGGLGGKPWVSLRVVYRRRSAEEYRVSDIPSRCTYGISRAAASAA